jgi:GNAT superfamily N-acetyltransferase
VEGLSSAVSAPEPLRDSHVLDQFDCGVEALNAWLQQRALRNEREGASRTYVIHAANRVIGYYSLSATSVSHGIATGKARRNMPDPIPAALLGRLALDREWQGQKLGMELLYDAVERVMGAADVIGVRAMLVHAMSGEAKIFYERFGFRASPIEPATLMMTVEEIRLLLARGV